MQQQFLQKFYNETLQSFLNTTQKKDELFRYTDSLIHLCQHIKNIFNNSKIAASTFCQLILNKLICYQLQLPINVQHQFLEYLKQQSKCTIYFTQISIRLFLLSYYCKQGQENKRKQWKKYFKEFLNQARMEFMFNYNESLATMLVTLINRMQEVCNQLTFYQKLIDILENMDLDYVVEQIKGKIQKNRQNWKKQMVNNKLNLNLTPTQSQNGPQGQGRCIKATQKSKNTRKSIKIITPQEKGEPQSDQHIRKRISDFREHQKRRLSQRVMSGKKRTIFQQRKYMKKTDSQCEEVQQNQYICIEQQNYDYQQNYKSTITRPQQNYQKQTTITIKQKQTNHQPSNKKYVVTNPFLKDKKVLPQSTSKGKQILEQKSKHKKDKDKDNKGKNGKQKQKQTDFDDNIMAPGTPPKKIKQWKL